MCGEDAIFIRLILAPDTRIQLGGYSQSQFWLSGVSCVRYLIITCMMTCNHLQKCVVRCSRVVGPSFLLHHGSASFTAERSKLLSSASLNTCIHWYFCGNTLHCLLDE